ncbi:Ig-like domain-containing protein, partial [candidate division KSB1 bacterium]|nr:Ig-like domain-containing protein [candidate division KSB1 bacterium]
MKKQIKSLLILCLTCLPTSSFSNELTISGTVRDAATGKPVPYIKVECINGADTFSAESGLDGRYNIFMQPSTNVQQSTTDYVPADFHLQQNYPNPFNPATTIQFSVPRNVNVQLTIYNILGQKVKTLVDKVCLTGSYSVLWDGTDQVGSGVSAGLYFYRLQAEDFVNVKKMILLDGAVGSWQGTKPSAALSQNGTGKLPKSANDFVTIRASSARIQPYEQSKVTLTEPETFFDIDVTLLDVSGFDKDRVVVSKPDPNSDVYTCGLPKAVVDTLSGTEKVKITNKRTFEEVVVDVNSHGGFRTTNLPGEIGDTLSFRVFSKDGTGDEQQLGETLDKTVYSMMVPQVCESSPANGDKDIIVDASINIRFTIPMDKSTITQQSFLLSSVQGDVSGNISFDDELSASFTPDLPLAYATIYTITLTTDIASLWGIPLGENYISSFTTSIGEPLIPDFQVNDDLGSIFHLYPSIATEKEGNFVIAWADGRNGNESIDVYAQKFSIDGKTIDNNFQVNNDSSSLLS